jgi:hypothetical protein
MLNWLNSLFTIPTEYQFISYLILGTIVVISVSLVYGFVVGMISSVFSRR